MVAVVVYDMVVNLGH